MLSFGWKKTKEEEEEENRVVWDGCLHGEKDKVTKTKKQRGVEESKYCVCVSVMDRTHRERRGGGIRGLGVGKTETERLQSIKSAEHNKRES